MLERVAAPNRMKRLLKRHEPALRMIYQGQGARARALGRDLAAGPEKALRQRLRAEGLWLR
jgi:hypothetical protein